MPRELSSTGMSVRVWNKVNSPKLEKILLPLKRTTKKSELKPLKDKEKKKVDPYKSLLISSTFFYQFNIDHKNTRSFKIIKNE